MRVSGIFSKYQTFFFLFLLFFLIVISYLNSLFSPLVLDDFSSFVDISNVYIDELSWESLERLSSSRFGWPRLLPLASFALDHYFGRGSIVQFHLTNVVIHVGVAAALFFMLSGLTRTPVWQKNVKLLAPGNLAFFSVMLWALNPVQTNAVTYVVQRMAAMSALFYCISLGCYIRARLNSGSRKKICFFFGFSLFAIMACLSKENSITLPLAVLLVEEIFLAPGVLGRLVAVVKWRYRLGLGVAVVLLAPLLAGSWQQIILAGFDDRHFNLLERLLTESRIMVFYLSLLVLPLPGRMNLDHDFVVSAGLLNPLNTIFSIILLAALLGGAFYFRRRLPLVAFGVLWFFLNLLVESTVVPLELVFEHRLYLPSMGFFLAVLGMADILSRPFVGKDLKVARQLFLLVIIILAGVSSLLTTMRNNDWRDDLTLYQDAADKSPRKPRAIDNLGLALGRHSRYDEAIAVLERAISLGRENYENYVNTANNIVVAWIRKGDTEMAIKRGTELLAGIRVDMNGHGMSMLAHNLGVAYFREKRYAEAENILCRGLREFLEQTWKGLLISDLEELFEAASKDAEGRKALGLRGRDGEVPLRMAAFLLKIREYSQVGLYLDRFLELAGPESEEFKKIQHFYLEELRKNEEQRAGYPVSSNAVYQENFKFRMLLGISEFILNNYKPLEWIVGDLLARAAKIAPDHPYVALYRARWQMNKGRYQAALQELADAIRQNQESIPVLELAGSLYLRLNQSDKAALVFVHILAKFPGHPKWPFYENIIGKEFVGWESDEERRKEIVLD